MINKLSSSGYHLERPPNRVMIDQSQPIGNLIQKTQERLFDDFPILSGLPTDYNYATTPKLAGYVGGYTPPDWPQKNGLIQCYLRPSHVVQALKDRPGMQEVVAALHGVAIDDVSSEMLSLHVVLHEHGHSSEFIHRYASEDGATAKQRFLDDVRAEKKTLPHGANSPVELLRWSRQSLSIKAHQVLEQERAYAELPREKAANDFAVQGMQRYGFVS